MKLYEKWSINFVSIGYVKTIIQLYIVWTYKPCKCSPEQFSNFEMESTHINSTLYKCFYNYINQLHRDQQL